ncbi:type II toxin-antitoxin system VapC family toxin [Domibacillus mangrovi]|uniref:PIN domain-containing protein n=1 Tax=Domibacillus mangrovi TaxID=1714354 RepID=A0A1Q5P8C7_9BACI|nr:PIN domain-containing protein [Domibacillus mangrovi]OKL38342.1 hypothetical protein BLL40_02690 [Domibacillus mangrovi]
MSDYIHLDSFNPNAEDKIFLDTNIWMYLYCSIGNYNENVVGKYNHLFEKIIDSEARIYTSALQISEFFNAYCRLEYNLAKESNPGLHYKRDFRNSQEFKDTIDYLKIIINDRIFKYATKLDDGFASLKLEEIFNVGNSFDFNDEYFVSLCLKDSILIVTNDRDFLQHPSEVKIISNLHI